MKKSALFKNKSRNLKIASILGLFVIAAFLSYKTASNIDPESNPSVLGISGTQYQCTRGTDCPSDILNLTNWKLTLPIGPTTSAIEIKTTDTSPNVPLMNFKHDIAEPTYGWPTGRGGFFQVNPDKTGVIFRAHTGGSRTSSGTWNPRSELRERTKNGETELNWNPRSGEHSMIVEQALNALPEHRPMVVIAQIHAVSDDWTVFRVEKGKSGEHQNNDSGCPIGNNCLYVTNGDDSHGCLVSTNVPLNQKFTVGFNVKNGTANYTYNGNTVNCNGAPYTLSAPGETAYFKTGMYTQSSCNASAPRYVSGTSCDEYGQNTIYRINVCHNGDCYGNWGSNPNPIPPTNPIPTNQSPSAVISATPTSGTAPLSVTFGGSGSNDNDGSIVSHSWSFGNGTTSTAANPGQITYSSAGTYTARLTVTDNQGSTGTATKTITVSSSTTTPPPTSTTNLPPIPVMTATPLTGAASLFVTFSASGSSDPDGTIVSYTWDLDDNKNPTGQNVIHTYTKPGTYKPSLTVKDNKGATRSVTQTIVVTSGTTIPTSTVKAVIGLSTGASSSNKTFTLDAGNSTTSSGSISTYSWEMGDGRTSTSRKFDHTYSTGGTYTIKLTVKNSSGVSAVSTMTIVVPN